MIHGLRSWCWYQYSVSHWHTVDLCWTCHTENNYSVCQIITHNRLGSGNTDEGIQHFIQAFHTYVLSHVAYFVGFSTFNTAVETMIFIPSDFCYCTLASHRVFWQTFYIDFISFSSSHSCLVLCFIRLFAFMRWNFHFSLSCFCHLGLCQLCDFFFFVEILQVFICKYTSRYRFQTSVAFPLLFLIIIPVSQFWRLLRHMQSMPAWPCLSTSTVLQGFVCLPPSWLLRVSPHSSFLFKLSDSLCRGCISVFPLCPHTSFLPFTFAFCLFFMSCFFPTAQSLSVLVKMKAPEELWLSALSALCSMFTGSRVTWSPTISLWGLCVQLCVPLMKVSLLYQSATCTTQKKMTCSLFPVVITLPFAAFKFILVLYIDGRNNYWQH